MTSNALTRRRRTLKRPIVCKSANPPGCGECELGITPPDVELDPNETRIWFLTLDCPTPPGMDGFMIMLKSGLTLDPPVPTLLINSGVEVTVTAPPTPGRYRMVWEVANVTGCRFKAVTYATVKGP